MNQKNIFPLLLLLIANLGWAQTTDITDGAGRAVSVDNITVTAEPTNLNLDTSNCDYVEGQLRDYINCIVENNQVAGADYHLHLDKDADYLNGVSTLDLVIIMRHIAGVEDLINGEHLVSADVNNDNRIDLLRIFHSRRYKWELSRLFMSTSALSDLSKLRLS